MMMRRTRVQVCKKQGEDDLDVGADNLSSEPEEESEEEEDEWQPQSKAKEKKAKPAVKKASKPRVPKQKAPRKTAEKKQRAPRTKKQNLALAEEVKVKEERLSFPAADGLCNDTKQLGSTGDREDKTTAGQGTEQQGEPVPPLGYPSEEPSSSHHLPRMKKEEPPEEDYTFNEPAVKKIKTGDCPQGKPVKHHVQRKGQVEDLQMNWDIVKVLSEMTVVEEWVCANIVSLFNEENTIPFIVRYRKEMINHMDADAVRDVQLVLEELRHVAKKAHSITQTLKKEGVLSSSLEEVVRNCKTTDELDHVYAPYKKGSKLSKARRARELGLEPAVMTLLQNPQALDLHSWVKPQTEGLSTLAEVETGVQQILADMIAKDKQTLEFVRGVCDQSAITIHSTVSKAALKEKEQKDATAGKPKDIDKFQLYCDFTANVKRVQHHQILAINRGENLKILTVKVNIPDRVKSEFCRWCVNVRWRPSGYAREEHMKILRDAVEDSYKRLILPLLCRGYRSSLTVSAEKESIAMFVRNLRQRLLVCPVRGRVILGVDPGFRHGCKLAVLSPTSQILQTDVVYLHSGGGFREAEKLKQLMIKHNCYTVVIGNGTACRETEAFFADLISKRFFEPLDVHYCITNEAGASIYSVSQEAVKEMPNLDPNLRSAVSIGRRVQDPLAELVKIDPKHIGIGTYQHDVSQTLLKAALDSVVQECVSFVGVDINICSETLMRHVAGLNAGRAKSIVEWREKNGPFINREQLKQVKGLGPKTFQQCAGFIRINPENLKNVHSDQAGGAIEGQQATTAGKTVKKKSKGPGSSSPLPNPLDQTCIHPESYDVTQRFLQMIGGHIEEIGQVAMRQRIEGSVQRDGLEILAQKLNTTVGTLQIIIDGLTQPQGFDIRQDFEEPDFKRGIVSMSDLKTGTVLTGKVENTTLFGAFVDIGVGRSGLIHKKYITENKLPADKRRRSLALGPGERVEVRVLNVDIQRGRIGLDLIRVLR
ncbi:S1 RNA-binding domain-containing protein 1 isoform X1 [Lepisosteus oculatus]|uniref:S1 RNA-binding domain-containing protein 1 isoform X1 n=2 Tax=Lepisosteus oculatus TaxID=7918 RepID=UPI0035F50D76